jgi:hypothetical protein
MAKAFLTPPNLPSETECRTIKIPSSKFWLGIFNSALLETIYAWNWEQVNETDLTPDECAAYCAGVLFEYFSSGGDCTTGVPAPYWDSDESADDELPADEQTWYGFTSGSFVEDIADWVLTGFIAASTNLSAAILYKTYVPRMRLAFRTGDWGGLIRITVDGIEAVRVNTMTEIEGIIEVPLIIDAVSSTLIEQAEILIERIA